MNLISNRHKTPLSKVAKKYNISLSSAKRLAKQMGISKTREQYLEDAKIRRETAFKLRKDGLKYKEIASVLNITESNAKMLVKRHQTP